MNQQPLRPIQLISFDSDRQLQLNPAAARLLNSWADKVRALGIVTVVGKYRTGKSFILNRVLLNQNSGFEVGPTINACTKGLWIWPELVQVQQQNGQIIHAIVMDTQGLGSLEQGENADTKIFLMAMLLSSYFIYNSMGSIDQKAISSLSLVVSLSKLLGKGSKKDMQDIVKCFPSFLWLVRDFALKLVDPFNKPISPSQYLQNALKLQPAKNQLAIRKNKVRQQLNLFFKDRDCFTLIRPVDQQSKLQNLAKLSDSQLRPQFLALVKTLRSRIFKQLKKKTFKAKPCNPSMLIQMCKFFCQAINNGNLPQIESSWDMVCKAQAKRVLSSCNQKFLQFIRQASKQDLKELNLKEFEQRAERKMLQLARQFQKCSLGSQKQLYRKQLKKSFNKTMDQIKTKIICQKTQKLSNVFTEKTSQLFTSINMGVLSVFQLIEPIDKILNEQVTLIGRNQELKTLAHQKAYQGLRSVLIEYAVKLEQQKKSQFEQADKKLKEMQSNMKCGEQSVRSQYQTALQTTLKLQSDNRRQKLQIQDRKREQQRLRLQLMGLRGVNKENVLSAKLNY